MNVIILSGRLVSNPEFTVNEESGTKRGRFTLAIDKNLSRETKEKKVANNEPTADFITIFCWGKLAQTLHSYTKKGNRVLVKGRLQSTKYQQQDGSMNQSVSVVAEKIEIIDWCNLEEAR